MRGPKRTGRHLQENVVNLAKGPSPARKFGEFSRTVREKKFRVFGFQVGLNSGDFRAACPENWQCVGS